MVVRLVPIEEKYAEDLAGILNDKELLSFLDPEHPYPFPVSRILDKLFIDLENWKTGVAYKFVILEGEEVVGQISLYNRQEDFSYEVGYFVGREFWGRGIATESVRQIVEFGFDEKGIRKVFAEISKNNPASIRVLEKAGFNKVKDYENVVRMEYENKV